MTEPISREGYPEILADLWDQVAAKMADSGLSAERAQAIGFEIAEHMREHWGGAMLYIPKGDGWRVSQRDQEIFDKFKGDNIDALVREFKLSAQQVYRIVKAVRAAQMKKRQSPLFPSSEG